MAPRKAAAERAADAAEDAAADAERAADSADQAAQSAAAAADGDEHEADEHESGDQAAGRHRAADEHLPELDDQDDEPAPDTVGDVEHGDVLEAALQAGEELAAEIAELAAQPSAGDPPAVADAVTDVPLPAVVAAPATP